MEIRGLLKSQVAEIAAAIARKGLNARDFQSWTTDAMSWSGYEQAPGLRHVPTNSVFSIALYTELRGRRLVDSGWRVRLRPGRAAVSEVRGPLDWALLMASFAEWLTYIKRESTADDFLEAFDKARATHLAADAASDDEPFSQDEQHRIARELEELQEQFIATTAGNAEFERYVRKQFDELRDELARMRRGRWKVMFVGMIGNLALKQVIPAETARAALERGWEFLVDRITPLLPGP